MKIWRGEVGGQSEKKLGKRKKQKEHREVTQLKMGENGGEKIKNTKLRNGKCGRKDKENETQEEEEDT